MKPLLAATAFALLAGSSCAFAQDHLSDYDNQSNMAAYNHQNDQAYNQAQMAPGSIVSANSDNLPRNPDAAYQPGDPDAVTDNYTATNQPPLGTAGPVPAVAVPAPPAPDNAPQ